jgi:hypothetical protein
MDEGTLIELIDKDVLFESNLIPRSEGFEMQAIITNDDNENRQDVFSNAKEKCYSLEEIKKT